MTLALSTAAFLALPFHAAADCGDYADNLLASVNCDADQDAAYWTTPNGIGSVYWEANDGLPAGSVRGDSDFLRGAKEPVDQLEAMLCVNETQVDSLFGWGLSFKLLSGSPECRLGAVRFTSDDCSGEPDTGNSSLAPVPSPNEWVVWTDVVQFPASHQSAGVVLDCSDDSGPFSVLVDNAYLVSGGQPPLFFDGFEDGDLSHWDP